MWVYLRALLEQFRITLLQIYKVLMNYAIRRALISVNLYFIYFFSHLKESVRRGYCIPEYNMEGKVALFNIDEKDYIQWYRHCHSLNCRNDSPVCAKSADRKHCI